MPESFNYDEIRHGISVLLERRCLFRDKDNEDYLLVRHYHAEIRRFFADNLGLQVILKSKYIKLEKIPIDVQPWMGIAGLTEKLDYTLFACGMAYIEEKGEDVPFLFSNFATNVKLYYPEENYLDWNIWEHRKSLVRVLNTMVDQRILERLNGDLGRFNRQSSGEIIEQNDVVFNATIYSRSFLRSFPENLQEVSNWHDLQNRDLDGFSEEQTSTRIKVLQHLLFEPGISRSEDNADEFDYLRRKNSFLTKLLDTYTDFRLELTRDTAVAVLPSAMTNYKFFPSRKTLDAVILNVAREINEMNLSRDNFGHVQLNLESCLLVVQKVKENNKDYLSKEYRDISVDQLSNRILNFTKKMKMISTDKANEVVDITPLFMRTIGSFSGDGE